jgi:ubiquinone/menaquinone biosynthesis C-methylase UbiE
MSHASLCTRSAAPERLPPYAGLLDAFHQAFRPELQRLVEHLPLKPESSILDVPCGDGFYASLLVGRLRSGSLFGVDRSPAYLDRARGTVADVEPQARVDFVAADAGRLPFDEGRFDFVWCAQSLISLRDPAAALRELRRVVRPGGWVAVLENDALHYVLLPWPDDLEAALQTAILRGSRRRYGRSGQLRQARRVRQLFAAAHLRPQRKRTCPADRLAPFDEATRTFLRLHLRALRDLVGPHLDVSRRRRFEQLIDEDDPASLPRRADAELTCLNTLFLARR